MLEVVVEDLHNLQEHLVDWVAAEMLGPSTQAEVLGLTTPVVVVAGHLQAIRR